MARGRSGRPMRGQRQQHGPGKCRQANRCLSRWSARCLRPCQRMIRKTVAADAIRPSAKPKSLSCLRDRWANFIRGDNRSVGSPRAQRAGSFLLPVPCRRRAALPFPVPRHETNWKIPRSPSTASSALARATSGRATAAGAATGQSRDCEV